QAADDVQTIPVARPPTGEIGRSSNRNVLHPVVGVVVLKFGPTDGCQRSRTVNGVQSFIVGPEINRPVRSDVRLRIDGTAGGIRPAGCSIRIDRIQGSVGGTDINSSIGRNRRG